MSTEASGGAQNGQWEIAGRDGELAEVRRLTADPGGGARALVIEGEAGIGKSALWSAGVTSARDAGWTVLSARGSEAETRLSFAGLADLLEPVADDVLPQLPEPLRAAMEVALIRRSPDRVTIGPREIGAATLAMLRELCASQPVVVAVDDLPWLDRATVDALWFAARRMPDAALRLLFACRTPSAVPGGAADPVLQADPQEAIGHGIPLDAVQTVRLGPLGTAVIESLLVDRLQLRLPARVLDLLVDKTAGNPFWSLEIGAVLARVTAIGDRLPVPRSLSLLVAQRLDRLPSPARQVLHVASALSRPSISVICAALEESLDDVGTAIDLAVDQGVVTTADGLLRPAHPLLGSAALDRMPPVGRAAMHRRLAGIVTDPEEKAAHLLVAASGEPDA
ncbi:MAG: AAA family ATPase, partial [Catenulispora sp.]|nr:AAA family ATPase [Catenulispora sp.]